MTPILPEDAEACVVVFWHHEWDCPAYQIYSGMLFGLPAAVTAFNRFSGICEMLSRRLVAVPLSMYFDDANFQDWESAKGSAQEAVNRLMTCIGSPFADAKRQHMAKTADFLGLEHDMANVLTQGEVKFWPRTRLREKLDEMVGEAIKTQRLQPGTASKLFGLMNFMNTGHYGRLGRSALRSIKDRQYESSSLLTDDIVSSFEAMAAVLRLKPTRIVELRTPCIERFAGASDAAYENGVGTGEYLYLLCTDGVWHKRTRRCCRVPGSFYEYWEHRETYIVQLELLMVYIAVISEGATLRGKRGIWYIDNVAALMALVRGTSDNPDLNRIAGAIHSALFALKAWVYFVWVESEANWSDGVSRLGRSCDWAKKHNFALGGIRFPHLLLSLPALPVMLVAQYL